MATTKNSVIFKGEYFGKEAVAGGTILPGHLISRNSADAVVVHAVAAGKAQAAYALENEIWHDASSGIGNLTTPYASGDKVFYGVFERGAEVNALVAAGAAAIVVGDFLESAGDGTLRKCVDLTAAAGSAISTRILPDVTATPTQTLINNSLATLAAVIDRPGAIAIALEAVDNSGGGAVARIKVEVL